jgi:hypothetical protein
MGECWYPGLPVQGYASTPRLVTLTVTPSPLRHVRQTEGRRNARVATALAELDRSLDHAYDPRNVPRTLPYEESVFYGLDQIAAGAFPHYGIDLSGPASSGTDNPLTEQMLEEYLNQGPRDVFDPATRQELDMYVILMTRIQAGASSDVFKDVVGRIGTLQVDHGMNYERNWLAALFEWHPLAVYNSRLDLRAILLSIYQDDPRGFLEAMNQLDLTGE